MAQDPHYDVALWQVHETENDSELIIRTTNGFVFYCRISPLQFQQSPQALNHYFKCLSLLRSGEEELDGFYQEDALAWLSKPFKHLIQGLAKSHSVLSKDELPTLSQYLFAPYFVCSLGAENEKLQASCLDTREHGWSTPLVIMDNDLLVNLNQWTEVYHPPDIRISYDHPEDILIKRPTKVVVKKPGSDDLTTYFFKRFETSFGPAHARAELLKMKKICEAQIPGPPEAWICRLRGVVRQGNGLAGMLFDWVDAEGPLSAARAALKPPQVRARLSEQIVQSVRQLHRNNIAWGDVKDENVLLGRDGNAWLIDLGGGYTPGWIDQAIAGTLQGDLQGLAKITNLLS